MLKDIPIKSIISPRRTLRPVRKNDVGYREMADSVKVDGVLQPILVRPRGDKYEVVEGNYRYEAAKEAGHTEIPCNVRELTDKEVTVIQLKANAICPETKKCEFARRLRALMQGGMSINELCALVNKSPVWVRKQLSLCRLGAKARKAVDGGKVKATSALALATMPEKMQEKFLDEAAALPTNEFQERAATAMRDYKAFVAKGKYENMETLGVARPYLRSILQLCAEIEEENDVDIVLEMREAKTPRDGWFAALAWMSHLDPLTAKRKLEGNKEKRLEYVDRHKMRIKEREIISQLVTKTGEASNE